MYEIGRPVSCYNTIWYNINFVWHGGVDPVVSNLLSFQASYNYRINVDGKSIQLYNYV